MNTITTHFFKLKSKKEINKVLIVFALLFMTVQTSWGQQVIGEFPDFNGGYESFAIGPLAVNATLVSGTQYSINSISTSSSQAGSISNTIPSRTGSNILTWRTSGTNKKHYSATVNTNGGIADNTAYTVQFWYQTSKSNTLGSSPTIAISPDGSGAVGTAVASTITSSLGTWVFKQISVTSGTSAAATKYGALVFSADNFNNSNTIYFDDMCVYAGAADNTVPTAASSPSTSVISDTSLNVNWTGVQYAGDGGGYVIVRSTSPTAVTLNQNGIYVVGNTSATGNGTIVAVTKGVSGTNQSFIDTDLTSGTYYYSIFAVDKAFNYANPVTCIGKLGTIWTGPAVGGSWSNGIPTASVEATILGTFDTSISTGGSFTAKKLTVNVGGTLLIKSGTTITVQNQIINNAGANSLIVENGGSLVQVNDLAVNIGIIQYSRKTTPISNMDYTYWSSPVQGFTLGGVSPNTFKFYSYNSILQDWQQESSTTAMTPGVGYIVRGPQLSTYMSPNPPAIYEATFSGVPNNGHYQISGMVANKLYLIGNPYPSALDADAFIDGNQNVLDGTLYFWTHNTPIATSASNPGIYAYSGNDYASYNRTGGTSTASVALNPGISSVAPNGKIASGQGFFVNGKNPALTNGDTTIDFYNSMRVGVGGITGNNSQFFKTNTTMDKNRVWLDLTNDQGVFKQILVGYVTGATNDYDSLFDGDTFDANPYVDFYSINQNKNLVIQGRSLPFDENDVVPLGFKTTITGPLTIGIENTDGLFVNQNIFIEDLLTNTITNLKNENYTFNATPGTFNDRFVLKYTNSALGLNTNALDYNNIIVYKNNDAININSGKLVMDNVKVYDLQGRLVLEQKNVNATTTSIKNLKATQQVLIVKVTTQDNTVVTKKVIN